MPKSIDVRTYELSDIDNNPVLRKSHLEEHPLNDNVNDDGIRDEVKNILHTNPFLYNFNNCDYKITSIEEFYIDVRKETKALGAVIRGQTYKINKKLKFTKKAFKKWKQDFLSNKERILNPSDDKMQIKDFDIFSTIKIYHYLGLIFTIIFIALILFKPGLMWTSFISGKVNNGIDQALSNKNFSLLTNFTFFLAISSLFYASLYNRVNKEHRKINNNRFILYKKANETVEKEFKKKFKYARKYYIKNVRNDKFAFAPLTIDKTSIEKVDLQEIEAITEAFLNKTISLKKQKKYFYFFKFITVYCSLLSGIFIFGYVVYFIIKNVL